MKKHIYAAGTLALLALTACSSQVAQTNAQLQIYAEESPFDMAHDIQIYTGILPLYQADHPGVDAGLYQLKVDDAADATARQNKLNAALTQADGPDLLLLDWLELDGQKLAESGLLYDIGELWQTPAEGYILPVLEAGVIQGQQFLLPLAFNVPSCTSTEEVLAQSGFEPLAHYDAESFCTLGEEFLSEHPDMALFPDQYGRYQAVLCALFPDLDAQTLESAEFQRTLELCRQNRQRQAEIQADAEEYRRGYTAIESGKFLFSVAEDTQARQEMGTYGPLGNATFFTLGNTDGTLNAQVVLFAAVSAASPNLQNASDFLSILMTQYQDVGRELPQCGNKTAMIGQGSFYVRQCGNESVIQSFQDGPPSALHYLNSDGSITKLPMTSLPDAVAEAYCALPTRVSHATGDYTCKAVLNYFDGYMDGTEELDRCTKRAVDYLTIHGDE